MNVQVNYLAVLLAGISSMVVGSLWYSPIMFGKVWGRLVKLDEKRMKKDAPLAMVVTFIFSLLMAFVLAHIAFLSNSYFKDSFLHDSLTTAFWVWLGFNTPGIVSHSLFEQRRKKLILLNVSNQLVTLLVMGLIIGLLKP